MMSSCQEGEAGKEGMASPGCPAYQHARPGCPWPYLKLATCIFAPK